MWTSSCVGKKNIRTIALVLGRFERVVDFCRFWFWLHFNLKTDAGSFRLTTPAFTPTITVVDVGLLTILPSDFFLYGYPLRQNKMAV